MEQMEASLNRAFPSIKISMDKPAAPNGMWFMNVDSGDRRIVVLWDELKDKWGFTLNPEDDTDQVKEDCSSWEDTFNRLEDLVVAR
jgi:hypothetical protein